MSSEQFLNLENVLFTIAMIGYLAAMVLYWLFFVLKKNMVGNARTVLQPQPSCFIQARW